MTSRASVPASGDGRRVVVIGSGPCGAAAARELVRCGIPVLMLESGLAPPSGFMIRAAGRNLFRRYAETGVENGTKHVATGDPRTEWWSNHSPGGLSNQWTGAVPRFAPEDFTEGERLHEKYGWPVTYVDLVPYYERVERLMDITASAGDVPLLPAGYSAHHAELADDWRGVARCAEAHGQGMTVVPLADGPSFLLARRGTAFNSYFTLVRPLERSSLFTLVRGAHALRLEWDGTKRRVTGVVYRDRADGSERRVEVAAVVVAGGPLDSTRLLFQSACPDFPDGLGNGEGVLGRYLHDHPREWWVFDVERPISAPCPSVYLTRLPHADSPPLLATSWTLGAASTRDKLTSLLGRKATAISVQLFGTTIPDEAHFVEPDTERKDPLGLPRLRIHMAYDEAVLCNVVQARDRLLGIMAEAGHPGKAREIVDQLHPGSSVHYGGTARMHEWRKYGVLDAWNRVYDVPNVVVGDASCFTTGPEKNPTLTAMALATRAAERLASDLKAGL
jgi:choline dehydrogenase-like flavoprotein